MRKTFFLWRLICIVVCLAAWPVLAQDVWNSKPYTQWAKEDIVKIISDSPWAQVRQPTDSVGALAAVTLRLRSSLKIRQALVRVKQIEAKYDKMNDKDRAAFDARMKGTLDCPACADNYVLSIGPPINSNPNQRPLPSGVMALRNATLAILEKNVFLSTEKGEKRPLVHFIAPKQETDDAMFFFPRFDDKGQPLLSPDSKKLIVNFNVGVLPGSQGMTLPSLYNFDVSRILVDGKVDF
jgi:hypothetical protein